MLLIGKKKFNRFKWIAIIKRKNKFVYKLNKYLKFKEINFKKLKIF